MKKRDKTIKIISKILLSFPDFKIIGLDPPPELSDIEYKFSVDEEPDYRFIKYIYENLWDRKFNLQ